MSIRSLPALPEVASRPNIRTALTDSVMSRWDPGIQASTEERSISVYDVIGQDFWTGEGVTAKRIAGALRAMGRGPVTVNINSPGGDVFEGIAIYNLLREHSGEVTVRVVGIAASSASIVAMSGDDIRISRSGFLMVHNAWTMAVGNRHDMRATADILEPVDAALVDVYANRSGMDAASVAKMLDDETWLRGADAIDKGLADDFLASDQVEEREERPAALAVRKVEAALRSSGMPANQAKKLISEFKSSIRDAAGRGGRDATDDGSAIVGTAGSLSGLVETPSIFRS